MSDLGLEVDEVAPRLKCCRRKVFDLLKSGELERVEGKPGRKTIVTHASVDAYVRKLLPGTIAAKPRRATPAPVRAPTAKDLERRKQEIERRRAALRGRQDAPAPPARRALVAR